MGKNGEGTFVEEIHPLNRTTGVLRGESPAVDARPALSTSDSTWLD